MSGVYLKERELFEKLDLSYINYITI